MTTKLTLTIDEKVIKSAKTYAHSKGKSLSNIVENYLKSINSQGSNKNLLSPKVMKLMGVIKLQSDFNYKSALTNSLSKKYKK